MRQPLKPLKSNEFAQNMALEKNIFLLNLVDISSDNQRPPGVRKIRQLDFWRQCVLQVFYFK